MTASVMSAFAWNARKRAIGRVRSGVPVGAAILLESGGIISGCNVELQFRKGIHAEVNALSTMMTVHYNPIVSAITIAAEAERFTPCGECMDWIMSLGSETTTIIHERVPGVEAGRWWAEDLMPFYPRKALQESHDSRSSLGDPGRQIHAAPE